MTESRPSLVITGGTEGVGQATVMRFAAAGYDIATCARRRAPLEALRDRVEALGVHCLALELDLSEPKAGGRLVAAAMERFGRVDVLVNNAGYAHCRPIAEQDEASAAATLAVNVQAVFDTTRACWAPMRERGGGLVVNVSSLASTDPFPGLNIYGAAKAWVNLFTKATADEGRETGIRAYAIALGAVETPMLRGLFPDFPAAQTLSPAAVADFIFSLREPALAPASGQTLVCRR